MFVKAMDICYNLDDGVGGENNFVFCSDRTVKDIKN